MSSKLAHGRFSDFASAKVQRIIELRKKNKKKCEIICIIHKKDVSLHSQMRNQLQMETGALDERFSLWSAKPAKAVRLRHAPQTKSEHHYDARFFCFSFVIQ